MMTTWELVLWSACLGVFTLALLVSVGIALAQRSMAWLQAAGFNVLCMFFVAATSGWLATMWPSLSPKVLHTLQIVSGAIMGSGAMLGLMELLRARQRDPVIQRGLTLAAVLSAACAGLVWWPDPNQALWLCALGVISCSLATEWMVIRAALQGDRLAKVISLVCIALQIAVIGLYGILLHLWNRSLGIQAFSALMAALFLVGGVYILFKRESQQIRQLHAMALHRDKDLLTQLDTGSVLIAQIDKAIARALRNRREMALLVVEVFNTSALRNERGDHSLDQMVYQLALRLRYVAGAVTEVGRYSDTSFVVILDSLPRPNFLRTMGLRLAVTARRPYNLYGENSAANEFRADIGVGIARVSVGRGEHHRHAHTGQEVNSMSLAQETLHDACELALESRKFASRVAILHSYTRKTVAVEDAEL